MIPEDFDTCTYGNDKTDQIRELKAIAEIAKEKRRLAMVEYKSFDWAFKEAIGALAWCELRAKGIHFGSNGTVKVIVHYSDGDRRAIFDSIQSGQIFVRHLSAKGRPCKSLSAVACSMAKHIDPEPAAH